MLKNKEDALIDENKLRVNNRNPKQQAHLLQKQIIACEYI